MENVYIMNHPLIQHKISMLRNKNTGTNEFRKLVEEIGILMGYEALRDLPVENVEVETPIETCMTPMISGKKLAVIPVPRLFSINPRPTRSASFLSTLPLRFKSDSSAYSIMSATSFKASSFGFVFFINLMTLWMIKYRPSNPTASAPTILALESGRNFDIYVPADMDKYVPTEVTIAMIRFAKTPIFIFLMP